MIKNLFYVFLQNFVNIILPFLAVPYIARTLGPEQNGMYSYTLTIINIINTIFSFSFVIYGTREIAKAPNEKVQEQLYIEIQVVRSIFLLVGYLSLFFFDGFNYILGAQGVLIIANIFDVSWYFQGKGDFKKVAIRNISVKVIGILLIFIFVKEEKDLFTYICLLNGSQLLGNIILFIDTLKIKWKKPHLKAISKHIKLSFILFLPSVAGLIYSSIDKIFLGNLNDMIGLGNYQQANKIITLIGTILIIPATVMLPEISNDLVKNQKQLAINRIKSGINFYLFGVTFIIFLLIINSKDISLFLFGNEYDMVNIILIILSPVLLFRAVGSIFGSWYLIPFEKNKSYAIPLIIGSIVNTILNIILIPKIGVIGATITLSFTELVIILVQLIFVKEIFYIEQYKQLIKYIIQIGFSTILISLIIDRFVDINPFLNILIRSSVVTVGIIIICIYTKNTIYDMFINYKKIVIRN